MDSKVEEVWWRAGGLAGWLAGWEVDGWRAGDGEAAGAKGRVLLESGEVALRAGQAGQAGQGRVLTS